MSLTGSSLLTWYIKFSGFTVSVSLFASVGSSPDASAVSVKKRVVTFSGEVV